MSDAYSRKRGVRGPFGDVGTIGNTCRLAQGEYDETICRTIAAWFGIGVVFPHLSHA